MDIRCPQCETVYEVDDDRITSESATLKCRECQHIFRLGADARPSREDQQRWMVRDPDSGDVLYFDGFETLHGWIREGKVDRSWEVSRSGRSWKTLGNMGELAPVFQVANNVGAGGQGADRRTEQSVGPRPGSDQRAGGRAARPADATSRQPDDASVSDGTTPGTPRAGAQSDQGLADGSKRVQLESGRFGGGGGNEQSDESEGWSFEDDTPLESTVAEYPDASRFSRSPVWWSVGAIVVMLLGAAAYVVADRAGLIERLRTVVSGGQTSELSATAMDAPRRHVAEAVGEATRRVDSKIAERVGAGASEASAVVSNGVAAGARQARRAHTASGAQKPGDQPQQKAGPQGFEATMTAADRALRNGAPQKALELYRRAAQLRQTSPAAQTGIGWAMLNLGRTQAAADAFRQALAARPDYGDALIGLGKAERERGRSKEALDAYRRYLEAHPDGPKTSIAEYQADQLEQKLGL